MASLTVSSLITFTIIAITCKTAVSVDLKDIVETCSANFITQDYKEKWDNAPRLSDFSFYVPLASKYHVYATTQNLFRTTDFKHITESQLQFSCLRQNKMDGWTGEFVNVTGYDEKSFNVQLTPTNVPKLYRFQLPYSNGGLGGYASIALTDNESYNVFDYCFDNGLRSFAVVSTSSQLDDTALEVIKAHVKSLGFKERNFAYLNYHGCYDSSGSFVGNKDDLPKPEQKPVFGISTIDLITGNLIYPTSSFFYNKKK